MVRLQHMAKQGLLPKRLATCKVTMCQACVYGKMTRKPWRKKNSVPVKIGGDITSPGSCTSVDQLETSAQGLIAQMKGIPTRQRHRAATVFVDHHSNLSFVYPQISTTSEETLQAKRAYEIFPESHGVKPTHYHADNGRFSDSLWREDILKKGQRLTFSGVGAHHQNGKAEKKIRDIQDLARASLMHAAIRWPKAINAHLWPYAIKYASDCLNKHPTKIKSRVPWNYIQASTSYLIFQIIIHLAALHMF
jgi:hypothetical protein